MSSSHVSHTTFKQQPILEIRERFEPIEMDEETRNFCLKILWSAPARSGYIGAAIGGIALGAVRLEIGAPLGAILGFGVGAGGHIATEIIAYKIKKYIENRKKLENSSLLT